MDLEEDYLKIKSRKRRKALDSDQKEQNAFDAFMEQRGLIAKRGNSFFCSGDSERAETYGNIYYVFPVNGFNFSWSLTAVDEVLQPGDVTESTFEEWDQYFQMTDKNLAAAMESKNEIYINGEAYVIRNPFEFNYGPGEEFEIFERKIKEEYKL